MKIDITQLQRLPAPVTAYVNSLERSIYQVCIATPEGEALLIDTDGTIFRRRNLQSVREALRDRGVSELVLRQQSAYDEMIGQPTREQPNTLELPLSMEDYAETEEKP